ncbi:MAG: glycine--tRNA ligase subunit beta [Nitrospirae bacterium]|nr:glycine--tRNA ligase subunit beta [Nitrospirota bacterium]
MKSFLLEIGTEEIPARFLKGGQEALRTAFMNFFTQEALTYQNISLFATPRRLAVLADGLIEKQADRVKELTGPPKSISYDKEGNLTKAAAGFAKSAGIDVSELKIVETERGEYLQASVHVPGRNTKDILSGALPGIITSIQFPKSMRWSDKSLRFVRPIRWILAILDNEVIKFEIEGIKSGNLTYAHRFFAPQQLKVETPSSYVSLLRRNKVIAGIDARREMIEAEIRKAEKAGGCYVHRDEELLDTVTSLVEFPNVITGEFDKKYLSLPKELPVTVMRTHQKYFSIEDKDGNLLPKFIIVSNAASGSEDIVRKGNERVLRARLEDARFYYEDDLKRPLWELKDELRHVTFQEELGSIFDKLERVSFICSFIGEKLNFADDEKLLRAVMLSKADLVTGVVSEFPELQGYMGRIYAEASGESPDTASAVYEHYLPRFAEDMLPSTDLGSIISIADKIDSIASFFYLDMIPTGSEDPFALRRQAAGILRILQEKEYPLTLEMLVEKALTGLEEYSPSVKTLSEKIMKFFGQRLEGILLAQGFSYDTVNAVLAVKGLTMGGIKERIEILTSLRKEDGFDGLLTAAKRVYNILGDKGHDAVKPEIFKHDSEKELFEAAENVRSAIGRKSFQSLYKLQAPVNSFFDSVLVMDNDEAVRANRLNLLFNVRRLFDSLADFSKIVQ